MVKKSIFSYINASIYKGVKKCDSYPQPITLNFKGLNTYQTFLGGCVSIFIALMMTFYSIILVKNLIMRQNSNNSLNRIFVDRANDLNDYYPYREGFRFGVAFNLRNRYVPIEVDESKITFRFIKFNASFRSDGTMLYNATTVGSVRCPPETGIYESFNAKGLPFTNIYCPEDSDFALKGNYLNENYTFFQVSVHKCRSNNCSSDEEIEQYINDMHINIIYSNSYVDFEDYDEPIKKFEFINSRYALSTEMKKRVEFKLRRNEAYFQDSLINFDHYNCFRR